MGFLVFTMIEFAIVLLLKRYSEYIDVTKETKYDGKKINQNAIIVKTLSKADCKQSNGFGTKTDIQKQFMPMEGQNRESDGDMNYKQKHLKMLKGLPNRIDIASFFLFFTFYAAFIIINIVHFRDREITCH